MKIRPGIELSNLTDTGCVRERNEDYYGYAEPDSEEEFRQKGRLAVIADGMGGHQGGQVASGIAVDVIRQVYFRETGDPGQALQVAFQRAHASICENAGRNPELLGMGTTCTAVAVLDHQLYYGHIGDSRLYLIRDAGIRQVTDDHSLVGRLVRDGLLSPEEAERHPDANVLTAALGMKGSLGAEFSESPIQLVSGDVLVMCTDGLYRMVSDDELLIVGQQKSTTQICQMLVEMARQRGGHDNITVQVIRIVPQ